MISSHAVDPAGAFQQSARTETTFNGEEFIFSIKELQNCLQSLTSARFSVRGDRIFLFLNINGKRRRRYGGECENEPQRAEK